MTFFRSVYFFDPDGVCLEFAAWTKALGDSDVTTIRSPQMVARSKA